MTPPPPWAPTTFSRASPAAWWARGGHLWMCGGRSPPASERGRRSRSSSSSRPGGKQTPAGSVLLLLPCAGRRRANTRPRKLCRGVARRGAPTRATVRLDPKPALSRAQGRDAPRLWTPHVRLPPLLSPACPTACFVLTPPSVAVQRQLGNELAAGSSHADARVAELHVRTESGAETLELRLRYDHTIRDLRSAIDRHRRNAGPSASVSRQYELRTAVPRRAYEDLDETLEAAGLVPRARLIIHPRK